MTQTCVSPQAETELDYRPSAEIANALFRLAMAVRYRKNLVAAVLAAAALIGGLYYMTATRRYAAKAQLLVTQSGHDRLDTSITNEESQRQSTMPTFENMLKSAKVLEGALKNLSPGDRIDFADAAQDRWVGRLQEAMTAKAIRSTTILEVGYRSKDPQVAVNVVRAIVQSYLTFMDSIHKGTAGEISRTLTAEREQVEEKLSRKQEELLDTRRRFADMGFRADGKSAHPTVQAAVAFNDALTAAQKQRVEQEALLATIVTAVANGEDLGQYLITVGDTVGRELVLSSLGLGGHDVYTQSTVEQSLLAARADLQAAQQNLGPMHPEVQALVAKIRLTEQFLNAQQARVGQKMAELRDSQMGPWLVQLVQQKVNEARNKESNLKVRFEEARNEAISLSGQMAQIELLERDVKRLGDMNDVLLNQIASLDLKQNGQEVRVAVIEEPVMSKAQVSPRLRDTALLTLLGGVVMALIVVILLDALDDRFRSVEEMQARLGLPLLTMVQPLEVPERTGLQALVTHARPTSSASESFRTLRTALTLTHPDARQIVVTSAQPGDGKTTTLANLAVCYSQADKRVLLVDADLRRPGLTNLLDMRGPLGLSEVLRSDREIGSMAPAHIVASGTKGLDILPSGPRPSDPAELLGSPRFSQLLAWAETSYDVILIDSPPTLATADTAIIGRLVDGVLLVVQPSKNRRRMVTRVVERLAFLKIPVLGLVVNHIKSNENHGYYGYQGYGYGYGYTYNYEYGHSDQGATDEDKARDGCVPLAGALDSDAADEEPEALVVPRRVA
jgi:polysaccharide biosynthesis transport protein